MSVSKKDLGEEHGEIRNLGSPILSKIQQAFLYIRTIATGKANDEFTSFRAVDGMSQKKQNCTMKAVLCQAGLHPALSTGAHGSTLNIGWDKAEARLVLVAKVSWLIKAATPINFHLIHATDALLLLRQHLPSQPPCCIHNIWFALLTFVTQVPLTTGGQL